MLQEDDALFQFLLSFIVLTDSKVIPQSLVRNSVIVSFHPIVQSHASNDPT
jgi:hypothetical protein